MPRRWIAVGAVVGIVGLSGCQGQLLFRNDHRITLVSPANFATVTLPVTVRWSARDFTPPADGRFLVFVDRSPQPPGDTINDFPVSDRAGIYVADGGEILLSNFVRDPQAPPAEQDHHEVTVILVGPDGRRIGETTGFAEFDVKR